MNDRLSIITGGKTITGIVGYSIRHNIYAAAGEYDIEVSPSAIDLFNEGERIDIKIEGITALTGIIERIEESGSKRSLSYRVSGRDLMGLVVDEYIQSFKTLSNKKLYDVADCFLSRINHVNKLNRTYMDGAESLDISQEWVQPQPGQTVFDLLSNIAASRGIHFYMKPGGEIIFGKPKGYGSHIYSLWRTNDENSNIIEWSRIRDISQRYRTIIILGQQQSKFDTAATSINQKITATDDTFPQSLSKTMVLETQTAAQTLAQQARMIIEQMRLNGKSIRYITPGHSQRGHIWQPDTICAVDDYRLKMRGEYLIYGRTFVMNKQQKTTELILGDMAS